MQDVFKARGTTRASKPDAGGANIRSVPVFAIVKDNIDPTRAGRLRVYISDFSGPDPEDSSKWITVNFLTSFFGRVNGSGGEDDLGSYKQNPSSYGEWHAPPDIGTTVICIFVNGDMNYGFYIGCVPEPQALQMIPAIGAVDTIVPNNEEAKQYGGATVLPVTNMNLNNQKQAYSDDFIDTPKPIHSYNAAIMAQQGIIRDPIRGPITTSAQREPASRVGWGVSTPGRPIYEGGYDDQTIADNLDSSNDRNLKVVSRRGGHSIIMDDGDVLGNDDLIRIRTARGHQITMSDNGQTLMVMHSNGQTYIELGKEGTVDVYSTNSINLRTQGDLNLHADNDVNIHATNNLNLHSGNMNVTTQGSLKQSIGLNWNTSALGLVTTKVTGAMSFEALGIASFASKGITFINGKILNLNTGKTPIKPLDVATIPLVTHTDTIFDSSKGFVAAPGKLLSITSRAPAHAPWQDAGKGVAVNVDLASASTKSSSSNPLKALAKAALNSGVVPVSVSTALSSPITGKISSTFDSATTSTMLGTIAQNTSLSSLKEAQKKGAAIVNSATGPVLAVGNFGQTPLDLEKAGITKPGSSRLVNSLVSSGANVSTAMPDILFSGQTGAENLEKYTKDSQIQAVSKISNLQRSQIELTNSGVITGNESSFDIAGVVLAGSEAGVQETIDTIKDMNKSTKL